jgi:hypothetical protein
MTKIATLHDAIVTKIATNLSTYTQLPNPYAIEDNPRTLMIKGFGVSVGSGIRTDRLIGCQVSWERSFLITLINYVVTTDSNTTRRETISKALLEDHYTLLTQFEIDGGLSGTAIDGVISQDGGIEFIEIDSRPYFLCEMELTVEYIEDLTTL